MTDILDLPDWNVLHKRLADEAYELEVEYAIEPTACIKCGVVGHVYRHGPKVVGYRDSPIRGHPVLLLVRMQRYRCRSCSGTFLQPLAGIEEGRRMTMRCVGFIEQQCLRDTFTRVAQHVGCHERTIRRVAEEYILRLESEYEMPRPEWLGIDEVHVSGKLRCVLTDVGRRIPVDILRDRGQHVVATWLGQFPGKGDIKGVTIDMWRPYRDLVRVALPGVPVVVDKYHVLSMVNRCLDRVRKGLREAQSPKERRALMRSRHMLMKRPHRLTDKQALDLSGWLKNVPELKAAYECKESFFDIYDMDWPAAAAAIRAWPASVPTDLRESFREITTALGNWEPEILAYFAHPFTNAYTEALNGVTKVINRQGRGYTFEVLRARVLFRKERIVPPTPAHRCESCGGVFPPSILSTHHIQPIVRGEHPTNALSLCPNCHKRFHTSRET